MIKTVKEKGILYLYRKKGNPQKIHKSLKKPSPNRVMFSEQVVTINITYIKIFNVMFTLNKRYR